MVKIIFTGAESSGKTTLARALSQKLNMPLVEEYARLFFIENNKKVGKIEQNSYAFEDLTTIAEGQLALENAIKPEEKIAVLDTDLLTIKIWSLEKFGKCDDFILQNIENQSAENRFYFLCSPEDIEWTPDPLRENPTDRLRLFDVYEKELIFYKKNYQILRGSFETRLQMVLDRIVKMILGYWDIGI